MMRSGGAFSFWRRRPGRHPIALDADLCYNVRSFLGEIAAIRSGDPPPVKSPWPSPRARRPSPVRQKSVASPCEVRNQPEARP